jgi:hypothetical protein
MKRILIWLTALSLNIFVLPISFAETGMSAPSSGATAAMQVHYRTVPIDGVDVFYREAGPKDGPVLILLHGFPTSSHMFRDLITRLDDKYHIIAPDYPGYGTGHFALESNGPEIAALIREFLGRTVK